jgi:RNA polymerase sigma-70 factor, ECF subfamily
MSSSALDQLLSIAEPRNLAQRERASPHGLELSDEELIARVSATHCKESLSILFERYARLVFTIANRLLVDATEAEETVQDCFLYLFQKAHLFDETKSSGKAWLVSVAYYRALDRRSARELSRCRLDLPELSALSDDGADFAASFCLRSDIERALNCLSDRQRKVLELHFFQGYSFKEICRLTDENLGNVRHNYYRAIEKLRKNLSAVEGRDI